MRDSFCGHGFRLRWIAGDIFRLSMTHSELSHNDIETLLIYASDSFLSPTQ